MGGKRKSKTNKLARMSEEEKLRYLQHRAAIEEEARRRKEQLISTFMKNKLKHEDAFSRLNTAKINQQWRQTLRQIKNNELHDAAETLRQTFNVAVQTKNKIIQTLLADLDDSVAMHKLAEQTHLESINKIIGIQEERLEILHSAYLSERESKLKVGECNSNRGLQTHDEDKRKLELDMFWQKVFHCKNYNRIEKLSEDFHNDFKYQVMSKMRTDEEKSAKTIESLKQDMLAILKNYEDSLSPFLVHYKQLREKDMKYMSEHIENAKIIHNNEVYIKKLKKILKSKENLIQTTKDEFQKNLEEQKKLYNNLRLYVKDNQTKNEKTINNLASVSSMTIQNLNSLLTKVTGIVSLGSSCQKFLTEQQLYCMGYGKTCYEDEYKTDEVQEIIEHFWKLFSEVSVEITSLTAHHANYIDENIDLKHSLVKFINTISNPSNLTSCILRDNCES